MKTLVLLLLSQLTINAQNLKYFNEDADKFITANYNQIKKNITLNSKDLVGKTIVSDYNYNNFYEKIFFVNDKYFLKIINGYKTLGHYKCVKYKGISLIVLFNEKGDHKALIVALKNDKKYVITWADHAGNDFSDISSLIQEDFKEEELLVDREVIRELNFFNSDISFYVKKRKIGIKLKGEKIIKNECDSLSIYGKMATIFNFGKIYLYNLNGKLLDKDLKADYSYSQYEHQVIDSQNNMYFIDTSGIKYKKPKETFKRQGNDFYDEKRFVTYYAYKNKILKTVIYCSPKQERDIIKKDTFNLSDWETYINNQPSEEDRNFIKKVYKNKKEYFLEMINYEFNEEIDSYYSDHIELPENYKEIRFINNSTKRIHYEDDSYWYSYVLKSNYLIAKKSNKYGVWDLEESKIIVPFDYKKIVINERNYFLLEKNGLLTYYPNIGLTPKYKYLNEYIVQFAKFEYPNGRKGWVDRKGREYIE